MHSALVRSFCRAACLPTAGHGTLRLCTGSRRAADGGRPSHRRQPEDVNIYRQSRPQYRPTSSHAASSSTSSPSSVPDPPSLAVGDVVRVSCDSLAVGGQGVCRMDGGLVCFVHRAWPGEELWARVTKVSKRFVNAVKTETVSTHDSPATPACQHFGPCGGCALQSMEYSAQLTAKRSHVVESLRRLAGSEDAEPLVRPAVGADSQYGYRNKVEFSFSTVEWAPAEGCYDDPNVLTPSWALGFHRPGEYDQVLGISKCELQGNAANRVLEIVSSEARQLGLPAYCPSKHKGLLRDLVIRSGTCPDTGEQTLLVQLVTLRKASAGQLAPLVEAIVAGVPQVRGVVTSVVSGRGGSAKPTGKPSVLYGKPQIMETILGLWFQVSAQSFFQTNPRQTEALYSLAAQEAELSPTGQDVVLDLYCGTGTIGLSMASRCREVHGFEINASAVKDARRNAERNNIKNAHFYQGDLETVSRSMGSTVPRPDVIITDPARAGMSPSVILFLRSSGARRIVYVSCNVTTQMRDLRDLAAPPVKDAEAAYLLRRVTPVDMFPQTAHIETVALLERAAP